MELNRRALRVPALVLTLSLPAVSSTVAQPAPAAARSTVSIANFGRISDSYFRGAQPKGHDYADLAALGVKLVIDLAGDGDVNEASAVERAGMKFVRIPLTTSAEPPAAAVTRFLDLVSDPANQPVYVHCIGGRHRTGIMTAVYRLTHDGWDADRAFAEMKQYQFEKGFISHTTLKNFVYAYSAQHPAQHAAAPAAR